MAAVLVCMEPPHHARCRQPARSGIAQRRLSGTLVRDCRRWQVVESIRPSLRQSSRGAASRRLYRGSVRSFLSLLPKRPEWSTTSFQWVVAHSRQGSAGMPSHAAPCATSRAFSARTGSGSTKSISLRPATTRSAASVRRQDRPRDTSAANRGIPPKRHSTIGRYGHGKRR